MRKPFMAANWKMNGSKAMARDFFSALTQRREVSPSVDVAIFPPFVYLNEAENTLKGSAYAWGAQNMSDQTEGAFTGEVSAPMLLDNGCTYVILGHSERREFYGETDMLVAKKVTRALRIGLKIILCVGETLQDRESGKTLQVVLAQLSHALREAEALNALSQLTIAYEPVWAIGTGKVPKPEEAQEVHRAIRQVFAQKNPEVANNLRILYGGSLKPDNAEGLLKMDDIDGGLVGGASLQYDSFVSLCNIAARIKS